MGYKEPQLAVSCFQIRLPVVGLGCIWLSYWLEDLVKILKQSRWMLQQRDPLLKLTVGNHIAENNIVTAHWM